MFKSIKLSYRHVWFASGVDGLCHRVDEVAGNPEIAHFHTSIPRDLSHTKVVLFLILILNRKIS